MPGTQPWSLGGRAAAYRMARAGLGLTAEDLGARAVADRLRKALEEAGAVFLDGAGRGVTVYVRTDNRVRPSLGIRGDLHYGRPDGFLLVCHRWIGSATIVWDDLVVGRLKEAGDFVALHVDTEVGEVGPFHFETPEAALSFLGETLVEQGRNEAPRSVEASDLVARYLTDADRSGTRVSVAIAGGDTTESANPPAVVTVRLTPPAALVEALHEDDFPRTVIGVEAARDWLQEAGMLAHLRRNFAVIANDAADILAGETA